jgi:hypothetical protein
MNKPSEKPRLERQRWGRGLRRRKGMKRKWRGRGELS